MTRLILLTLCASLSALSQNEPFEAASIHIRQGAPQWKFSISGSRLSIESYTLFGLVKEAWNLQNYQIEGKSAPPLLLSNDTLYDIEATAGTNVSPTREQFRLMLQRLLADRFQLKVHTVPTEMPIYALTIGKNGPKFAHSTSESPQQVTVSFTGANKEYALVTCRNIAMESFATILGVVDGRPVVDKTGLAGTWDITLYNTPEYKMSHGPEPALGEISILTAVQEQLGLKLEPEKGMIPVLVVDSVSKPSEN